MGESAQSGIDAARAMYIYFQLPNSGRAYYTRVLVIFNPRRDTYIVPGPPFRPSPRTLGVLKVTYTCYLVKFFVSVVGDEHQTVMVKNTADTSPVISVRPIGTPNLPHNSMTLLLPPDRNVAIVVSNAEASEPRAIDS